MTEEQIKNACREYRQHPNLKNLKSGRQQTDRHIIGVNGKLQHCAYMCDKILSGELDGKIEKLMRWIGFIQGVLWSNGIYTIDNLKDHNR